MTARINNASQLDQRRWLFGLSIETISVERGATDLCSLALHDLQVRCVGPACVRVAFVFCSSPAGASKKTRFPSRDPAAASS